MNNPPTSSGLYQTAGVDDNRSQELVHWLQQWPAEAQPAESATHPKANLLSRLPSCGELIGGIGGFAAMHELKWQHMQRPTLVTATDGVGTKLLLAITHNQLQGLGQDLVAMCANDLFTLGARPLGFLDYYATSQLDESQFKTVLSGINVAAKICGCALAGGETAQMPGFYQPGEFDLSGFIYGVVDRDRTLGAHRVQHQDRLYALPSSGFHANGFSLLRHWLHEHPTMVEPELITKLLAPTELYPEVSYLSETTHEANLLHACAHITGGGLSGNLLRVLPRGATARLDASALPIQPWMRTFLETAGQRPWWTFEDVFNLGCGMILAVAADGAATFENALKAIDLPGYAIGAVDLSPHDTPPQFELMNTSS